MWVGRFEKLLEMIFGRPPLVFEVTFDRRYTLITGVTGSLVVAAVATVAGY
jgi:hypothetical protein